ncbi:hypothetical protein HA402_011523 [Bradysia odoriphaga]|nr:hypothetical protein HA402_011523 [Bradysia odoriphaga]
MKLILNAIDNTGYGTQGKIFLEFEEPFWPTDVKTWASYILLWKQEDKDKLIGREREWLLGITSFIREDAQPNLIGGLTAGKHIKQFEDISDQQLIDDCMWLLEKFLGRAQLRPIDMRRNRWMSKKYFLGTYSYGSMVTQTHNVEMGKDLGETLYSQDKKSILLIVGEATDEAHSGYVHGAVASG